MACERAPATGKRVLAELFSSEGCDACPPAERFFAGLAPGAEQVAIVWHVDYFDAQGWKDRFALPESSRRQQVLAMQQPGAKIVATPQAYLDGQGAPWRDARAFRSRVLRGAAATPAVALAITRVEREDSGWQLQLQVDAGPTAPSPLRWQAVLVQNGLRSQVTQGENQGLTLLHGHVVRSATGPLAATSSSSTARTVRLQLPAAPLDATGEPDADFVAWAEDAEGKVLNATWARCVW